MEIPTCIKHTGGMLTLQEFVSSLGKDVVAGCMIPWSMDVHVCTSVSGEIDTCSVGHFHTDVMCRTVCVCVCV